MNEDFDKPKILITDDNPENIHVLSKNLEDDYEVMYVTTGEKALDIAFSDECPDLILLDIVMPGMDGYEVCEKLKADAGTRDIPVIFITGMSQTEDETKGLALGATDYISKPFSMPVVQARISAALHLKMEKDKSLVLTKQLQDLNKYLEKRVTEKVAELRLAHEELKASEIKFRSIFENAVEGIYQATPEGLFLTASPSMAKMLGYDSPEELVLSVTDIGLECYKNPGDHKLLVHTLTEEGVIRGFETWMKKKDADIICCSVSACLIRDDQGQGLYIEGFCMDISRQKQAEQALQKSEVQLRQAQKMEAIGTMAGGIAHDFNNILFPVIGYAEMMSCDIPENSHLKSYLNKMFKGLIRASELVKQILTFSRQADQEYKPLKIQTILKEVLKLSRATLPATIEISQDIQTDCGMVMADPIRIHQIVMNLITNAFHAMEDKGGVLTITLTQADFTPDKLPNPELSPGCPYVCLTVADTGIGMDPVTKEKIFDPYFTTKEMDKGTGLGLSIVHGIVKNYNGAIAVKSTPGKGTSIKIFFPVIVSETEDKSEKKEIPVKTGTERILLVDDEELITGMLKSMTEYLGYQVSSYHRSADALEAFRTAPDNFDIVITDMTMPNITGDQLAVELKKIRSDIPIILCTGFSKKIEGRKASEIGVDKVLLKPIGMKYLANAVRDVLDNRE
ncbi:MAG: response regulator [Desulfobacteraceae bacterium]|nr:response regulator [Desulfobacteraceae bacterium]